ncbi:MAG: hypothetical protein JWN03_3346 [Nocardia sp.]|uniref:hemerythrin domain-containing protein n=1 Tax=Nocardia sp. TaxID=1821 RepID=UPI0026245AB1|nr:hemerythrin domain-containing protein [Nocardia sp.]MCU1643071.1 hypothetical protein [Nocardia sp.]
MALYDTGTPAGQQMVAQLRAIHQELRRDLAAIQQAIGLLAEESADHAEVAALINGLTVADFAWQLRVNCDYYCLGVNRHHAIEDDAMLPVMRRRFPEELGAVVDRLSAEHHAVARLTTTTRRAAINLTADAADIAELRQLLTDLGDHLLAHLDYEEASLFPYFLRMDTDWHYG